MDLLLRREPSTLDSTPRTFSIDGEFECFTLDDVVSKVPDKPVQPGRSQAELQYHLERIRHILRRNDLSPEPEFESRVPHFRGPVFGENPGGPSEKRLQQIFSSYVLPEYSVDRSGFACYAVTI